MGVKIVITAELAEWWATPEEFSQMTDEQIVELAHEDTSSLIEDAEWKVVRP
jgi:hypothetical protein